MRGIRSRAPGADPGRPRQTIGAAAAHEQQAGRGARAFARWRGALAAAVVPPVLTAVLDRVPHGLNLTSRILLFLVAVVAVARLGGMLSALAAAIWASLLLNYYFIFPLHSASIADANDAIALGVFVIVALTVASVVDLAARQSRRAARANAEAETLNVLSVSVLRGDGALGALLDQLRETFGAQSVSLLQPGGAGGSGGSAAGIVAGGRIGRADETSPTADLPTSEPPTAELPTADIPTAELPDAVQPIADLPDAELSASAASLSGPPDTDPSGADRLGSVRATAGLPLAGPPAKVEPLADPSAAGLSGAVQSAAGLSPARLPAPVASLTGPSFTDPLPGPSRPPTAVPSPADHPNWIVIAASGPDPAAMPAEADTVVAVGSGAQLALRGRVLSAADQHVLSAFTAQATAALERRELAQAAAYTANLEAADKMRTALLAAVSHDLRSPLSAARAAVNTLADPELDVGEQDRVELLDIADESLARLTRLVEDLLDMSRLQAGALKPRLEPFAAEEIVPPALDGLSGAAERVRFEQPDPRIPAMLADGPLLERVVANLVANAIQHTDTPVQVTVSGRGSVVELRVTDHGPGIPESARELVFRPFQRLGDRDTSTGVGLGLALARGLAESMGGTLVPEQTPGGGLTMVVGLPAASDGAVAAENTGGTDNTVAADAPRLTPPSESAAPAP